MERFVLRSRHAPVEATGEPPMLGEVRVENGPSRGVLLTPDPFDPGRTCPLFTVLLDRSSLDAPGALARIYLEYGTHDPIFPFDQIAIPMRDNLRRAGYDVTFSVDEGGRHMPSGGFQGEALDGFLDAEAD